MRIPKWTPFRVYLVVQVSSSEDQEASVYGLLIKFLGYFKMHLQSLLRSHLVRCCCSSLDLMPKVF